MLKISQTTNRPRIVMQEFRALPYSWQDMRTRKGVSPFNVSGCVDDNTQLRCGSRMRASETQYSVEIVWIINFNQCRELSAETIHIASSQFHFTLELRVPRSFWLQLCEIRRVKTLFVAFIKVQTIEAGAMSALNSGSPCALCFASTPTDTVILVCVAMTILNLKTRSKLVSIAFSL